MISKVTVQNFKQFKDTSEFVLKSAGLTFLAGGNNSGKSTLLQALTVWEFARSIIEIKKGRHALELGARTPSFGINIDEFSPIALPNLKYLFSDLRVSTGPRGEGYPLRIRCEWTREDAATPNRHLEFGLAHANDRLFLKCSSTNLDAADHIPRLAYLPSFAGIGPREEKMSPAIRKRWIGRGLAGSVLRNLLYDFWEHNRNEREAARAPNGQIPRAIVLELRRTHPWEQLLSVLEEVFKTGLTIAEFDVSYHTTIDVTAWAGHLVNGRFKKKPGASQKDLMVEGSGFLQWLSVYALAVSKELNGLLLDEPDAHLHPALQGHLIHKLGQLARETNKQVLLATHSTTILSETRVDRIFRMEERKYLDDERGRVALFIGLGSQYAPRLDQLKRLKRLFLHDGPSDLEVLHIWARTLGLAWPDNLVCWKYTKDRSAREILFDELRAEIPGLMAISLQDRDDYPFAETRANLTFDSLTLFNRGLGLRRWRRRNLENHLLHPGAIARAAGKTEHEVRALLSDPHGLHIPPEFTKSQCVQTLANTDGKEIITNHVRSVRAEFGVDYKQIAEAMTAAEIPDDPKTLLNELIQVCLT
jgi:energy-coupling factor transporter ATP-binding protein EcfA2